MEKIDHLIHAKWLITCEEQNRVLENHAMAIKDQKILAILPSEKAQQTYQASQEYHYSSHAVLPGLINSHTHIGMNFFRGLADDLELMDWLNNHVWPAEKKWLSHEFVYDASLMAMAEMIRCGTTCFNDMFFFLDATASAALTAGMRAHIGMHIIGVSNAWAKTPEECFDKALAFYHQYKDADLITPTMAPHSTYTLSLPDLIKAKEIADEYQLKINIHLQETSSEVQIAMQKYNKRPLQLIHEIGMVSPNLIAIHMTQIDERDCEILQQTKPTIVNCPESNMKLASGACPVDKMAQLGVNIALGTDSVASNNDLDMLGEMRSAALVGKITAQNPRAVAAEQVLKMATINGAKALGIDHLTGSLVPGKAADFIAIDLDHIETLPVYRPVSQIVYSAARHQVSDVWVAGKQLMKNRQLLTLDEKELLKKAQIWRKKIKS
ncbi:MAG: TRZ/ATZ family hydrolase [Gammaproteobacteria bacterium]|nr:MAG: TRZ/ATZ family hydrolase [Gammaproteobacteria bacterium]